MDSPLSMTSVTQTDALSGIFTKSLRLWKNSRALKHSNPFWSSPALCRHHE